MDLVGELVWISIMIEGRGGMHHLYDGSSLGLLWQEKEIQTLKGLKIELRKRGRYALEVGIKPNNVHYKISTGMEKYIHRMYI